MIGMSFGSFIALAILGLISAFVLHVLGRYRMLSGADGFIGQWIAGWVGAWLGSPVLGYWGIHMAGSQFLIPALIGAFVGSFMATATLKAMAAMLESAHWHEAATTTPVPVRSVSEFEMRKAS